MLSRRANVNAVNFLYFVPVRQLRSSNRATNSNCSSNSCSSSSCSSSNLAFVPHLYERQLPPHLKVLARRRHQILHPAAMQLTDLHLLQTPLPQNLKKKE